MYVSRLLLINMHLHSRIKVLIIYPLRFIAALWRLVFNRKVSIVPNTKDDEEALVNPSSSFYSTKKEQDNIDSHSPSTVTYPLPSTGHLDKRLETIPPPPVSKRKALLIGIQNYGANIVQSPGGVENDTASEDGRLKGPHNDVLSVQRLLLDCYAFNPDDITLLIDDCEDPDHQPTEDNILRCMKELVADARPGDQFYLHYSGHGTQIADDDDEEEDGWDECIMTCDNKEIRDDILNRILVAPLPVGSTFVSIFDSCHSGTVLDLKHYRCNRVYVPWTNKGSRRTDFLRNIVTRRETQILIDSGNSDLLQVPVIQLSDEPAAIESSTIILPNGGGLVPHNMLQLAPHPALSITTQLCGSACNWTDSSSTPLKYLASPAPIFCTGGCREEPEDPTLTADVISLSATKDYQRSWEDSNGASMTAVLVKVLRKDPHSSLKHVLTSISHELHDFYVKLHDESRSYKNTMNNVNLKRQRNGKGPWKSRTVEMNNFQNPQLSSHHPLDMDRPWPL